jgi:DNA polymerase III epsilon subunit
MKIQWRILRLATCAALTLIANISNGQSLSNVLFVAFDTETTSLDARSGRIVEIGAVKFRDGKILATTNWLINPGVPMTPGAQQINGLTDEMLAGKPAIKEVLPEFVAFVKDATLLAHNAQFDTKFLRAEFRRSGIAAPTNDVLDTLKLSRAWFPQAGSYELGKLVEYLKLPEGKFHRTLVDAKHLMDIFMVGVGKLPGSATIEDLKTAAGGALKIGTPPKQPHSFRKIEDEIPPGS